MIPAAHPVHGVRHLHRRISLTVRVLLLLLQASATASAKLVAISRLQLECAERLETPSLTFLCLLSPSCAFSHLHVPSLTVRGLLFRCAERLEKLTASSAHVHRTVTHLMGLHQQARVSPMLERAPRACMPMGLQLTDAPDVGALHQQQLDLLLQQQAPQPLYVGRQSSQPSRARAPPPAHAAPPASARMPRASPLDAPRGMLRKLGSLQHGLAAPAVAVPAAPLSAMPGSASRDRRWAARKP